MYRNPAGVRGLESVVAWAEKRVFRAKAYLLIRKTKNKMENRTIRVFAPASTANLGCGFDVMGMALDGVGDVLRMSVGDGDSLVINNESGINLPSDIEKNVITPAVRAFMAAAGKKAAVEITVEKKILPGSGIGSSAASSAAAVFALNELFGRPFTVKELVDFAMQGEKLISGTAHADNSAPAVMGGIVFIRGYDPLDIVSLPVPDSFCFSVVHPHIMVSTKDARDVLRKEIPMREAVTQWGNVGGLVAGIMTGDMPLIGRSMRDVVVEPYRKGFIPGYDELKAECMAAGALAVNISGSGPSVFALSDSLETAEQVGKAMKAHFGALGIENDLYVSHVPTVGARVVE